MHVRVCTMSVLGLVLFHMLILAFWPAGRERIMNSSLLHCSAVQLAKEDTIISPDGGLHGFAVAFGPTP